MVELQLKRWLSGGIDPPLTWTLSSTSSSSSSSSSSSFYSPCSSSPAEAFNWCATQRSPHPPIQIPSPQNGSAGTPCFSSTANLEKIKEGTYLPHNYDVEYCFEGWSVMMRALQGECHACWYRVLAISIPPRLQESYYPSFGFNHRIYHWSSFDLFHTSYCKTAAICPVD